MEIRKKSSNRVFVVKLAEIYSRCDIYFNVKINARIVCVCVCVRLGREINVVESRTYTQLLFYAFYCLFRLHQNEAQVHEETRFSIQRMCARVQCVKDERGFIKKKKTPVRTYTHCRNMNAFCNYSFDRRRRTFETIVGINRERVKLAKKKKK